ncbi:hypothetical protein [Pseudonocardia sp. TRM90224]|uniref:hypothetical protein n=1 Tax=Pseudonocardia sp. TRM90224 TaxID=2812678 RepID=UPI001E38BCC8|nr:hypothetical protein [Pseudonocardia sp. TRM90224]
MVLRIGGLPVWVGPSDMIAGARAVMGWTDDAVELVAALPQRITGLLSEAEDLVARINGIADAAESIVARAEGMVGSIDGVLGEARTAVTGADTVLTEAGALVKRIDPLLTEVGTITGDAAAVITKADAVAGSAAEIVTGAGTVTAEAEAIIATVGGVTAGAEGVIQKASAVADRAHGAVENASGAAADAVELLALYQPIVERGAPLARRFVEEFSEEELLAAIRLVDQLPQLTEHVESDIMPILATLDRVGPDVHELLGVLKDVRMAIQGIPGFRMLRRRGEQQPG